MNRYLTKSRFMLGIECPTKLYYTQKEKVYADENIEDPFLEALAEGGFQVAELAKFLFCEDPVMEDITIRELNYETALAKTKDRLNAGKAVVAEAAFKYENLFVRTDILVKNSAGLQVYEVKSKSWGSKDSFWKKNKDEKCLSKDWLPYLYDVAYQKYVLKKIHPTTNIKAYLILANKDVTASIEELNQRFRIQKENGDSRIIILPGTTRSSLGTIPLIKINVDEECDWIYSNPVQVDLEGQHSFEETVSLFSDAYKKDERIWSILKSKCKTCQFNGGNPGNGLKSGFRECWKHLASLTDEDFERPLVLELWGGKAGSRSIVSEAIAKGKYFLSELEHEDYCRHWPHECDDGLHASERREMQILKARNKDSSFYLDKNGIEEAFKEYERPWHFIDFETSMVALPFHAGRKPYEAIAFQYSYHLMEENGKIEHKSEYICLEPGFPNYEFVRSLKKDLGEKSGTIFRYHNHENSYLKFIYKQLLEEMEGAVPDRDQLIAFIKEITHSGKEDDERWQGKRDMQDLWNLVLKYYYSPKAKGSNSIKDILPAAINDSRFIREKYSRPIYGTPDLPSLNFNNHTWITEASGLNPYKTLPPVLAGIDNDKLDEFLPAAEEISDGGAAMMAYAFLQFTEVPLAQKDQIRKALLRYCELDTMAMVMIWEFWGNEIGVFG